MNGIVELYPKTQLLGLTATPTYTDKKQRGWLWEIFKDGIIYEVTKKELEDQKILASPVFIQEKTNFNLILSDSDVDKLILKHQELPSRIIEEIAKNEERNHFIAAYYHANQEKFGKTIIFLDRWYQCKTVENYINKKAGKEIAASIFSYIDGNKSIEYINNRVSNQNEINLNRFRNGEIQVLINVKMLTEGVDVPDVKTVFLTRDTNSSILFTQMVGRALRGEGAGGNKTTANIVLFSDEWNRHIQFASSRFLGGKEDESSKERGYRPFELIRIELLEQLELEYYNNEFIRSVSDFIPIGWYVVAYTDLIQEDDGEGQLYKTIASFKENIVVLEDEVEVFDLFIQNYSTQHKNPLWENEELDIEKAENLISNYLVAHNFIPNKATIVKLIQIARHLGQNNTSPDYFTFEQKDEINLRKLVLKIREENWGRDQAEDYLENEYLNAENTLLKVLFPRYEDFYRAYEYEDNVYRRSRKKKVTIKESDQGIYTKRLASEEVRKRVLSRDGHRCLCCGKTTNLQIDHIISFKEEEPDDDNPDLYQTLCSTCNKEKSSHSFNYRYTHYDTSKMRIENVLTTNNAAENPIYYFTRLINCFYKTSAVQPNTIHAKNNGNSIWKAAIKYGDDPSESILKHKEELIRLIKSKGFNLKDIQIQVK